MEQPDVKRTAAFMRLLHALQSVERVAHTPNFSRRENDVEHSYFLAMLCWYLHDALKLSYSTEKILRYALAHDVVEAYAGDTYILDTEALKTKGKREQEARVRIKKEFPEFNDLHTAIERYENRNDPEAIFVHAVDKVLPLLINYIQDGYTWKKMGIAHAELFAHKRNKVGRQKEARELLEQIIAIIENDWKTYFVA